jgi:hypothetical protein
MENYELNPIESVLQVYGKSGLSISQLKEITSLSKRSVNKFIYTSKFIEDTSPYLHGSGKTKINVYNYTPIEKNYFKRREKKRIIEEIETV